MNNLELPLASLPRRLACSIYEALLLLGVLALGFMLPHLLLGLLFQISVPGWLTIVHIFGLVGVYCVWYWVHGGQTLAMQTWGVRLIKADGKTITLKQAAVRYILACAWVVPAVLVSHFVLKPSGQITVFFLFAILFSPLYSLFDRENLFLQDRLARTRLVYARREKKETCH